MKTAVWGLARYVTGSKERLIISAQRVENIRNKETPHEHKRINMNDRKTVDKKTTAQ